MHNAAKYMIAIIISAAITAALILMFQSPVHVSETGFANDQTFTASQAMLARSLEIERQANATVFSNNR